MRPCGKIRFLAAGFLAAATLGILALPVSADDKEIKIGVIFDYTGPYAAGGSALQAAGARILIDYLNREGGVEGYKINAIYADAQSKPEVAVNETVRLIEQENVHMLLGFYSSAECVPVSARVEKLKNFMWMTGCSSPAVVKDRHFKYAFRPQPHGGLMGSATPDLIAHYAKEKLGIDPKELRVAIIHEDGPYGVGMSGGNVDGAEKHGFNIVLKEGYAATAPDMSSLVTKLKRARPDVIFHTGYNPDITLFLRTARELGLKWKALLGHGAGHGAHDMLYDAAGNDADYIFNIDPPSAWLIDPEKLAPGLGDITRMVAEEYRKQEPDVKAISLHVGMSASNAYVFFSDVMPRAITKYGGIDPDSLRKAAMETDIPVGGTLMGFGVKFYPPEHEMAGQNERAFGGITQFVDRVPHLVWPRELSTFDPVLPLPAGHTYAAD